VAQQQRQQQPQQHQPHHPQEDNHEWFLQVRCPRTGRVLRICIFPSMTPESVGRCIHQAFFQYQQMIPDPIVGMFRERDYVFHSLEYLLQADSNHTKDVYSVNYPNYRAHPPPTPRWRSVGLLMMLLTLGACYGVIEFGPEIMEYLLLAVTQTYNFLFDLPLRELYRYGPYMIGWEGAQLSEICSRITYHGDRAFWSRNMEDCEFIYAAKEEAFLRVARPVVYGVLVVLAFIGIRHLVRVYAERRRQRVDRDMVETYRAFQILLRQTYRLMGGMDRRY